MFNAPIKAERLALDLDTNKFLYLWTKFEHQKQFASCLY